MMPMMFLAPFVILAHLSISHIHAAQLSIGNAAFRRNNVKDAQTRRTGKLMLHDRLAFQFRTYHFADRSNVLRHKERRAGRINWVFIDANFRYTNHQRGCNGSFNDWHRSMSSTQNDIDETRSSLYLGQPVSTTVLPNANSNRSKQSTLCYESTRRTVLFHLASLSFITASQLTCDPSQASEIDATGQLYSPKNDMISRGGSDAARGIALKSKTGGKNTNLLKTGGLIQNVYETRFVAYLTRFLLVFDPAASAWWKKNALPKVSSSGEASVKDTTRPKMNGNNNDLSISEERFAEFAESVEIGLADYFVGPYGSYASVAAAKAGITAAEPAKSVRKKDSSTFWDFFNKEKKSTQVTSVIPTNKSSTSKREKTRQKEAKKLARQGVLNLFSLLKARYTTTEEKQQLALLFSLISDPELQPVNEIRGLLGELDNGTIAAVELLDVSNDDDDVATAKDYFRLSSRQGGGFAKDDAQIITVEPPAPLGDEFKPAKIRAMMKPTSRILRINVVDGGEGYYTAPEVIVKQKGVRRQCEAYAVINQRGHVSDIIVVNPGFGYGGEIREGVDPIIPTVEIVPPKTSRKGKQDVRVIKPAKAVAELEYKVYGVEILDGGSGYILDEPPDLSLSLPAEDPDWFVVPKVWGLGGMNTDDDENQMIAARVSLMKSVTNNITVDPSAVRRGARNSFIGDGLLQSIQNDPIALLPSYLRPQFSMFVSADSFSALENGFYYIPALPTTSLATLPSSSYYRSIDPLFGGIGKAPVMKNALTLSADQYSRLALAGAICTVLVRTALNPLELVKTKIQLKNDDEIMKLAMEKSMEKTKTESEGDESKKTNKPVVGTTQVIQSLIEIRGPLSLFQSADITFLTSVVFGLFGFGATELFRRSFSAVFFDESSDGSEFVLLAAAAFATLLTCAAGAPFEIIRVRSMSIVEAKGVKEVFFDLVEQNRLKGNPNAKKHLKSSTVAAAMSLEPSIQIEDIKPLWRSFSPIVSRELPFAVTKFLVFDLAAGSIADFVNRSNLLGDGNKIQVGVGTLGLLLSALSGAFAGIAGAFVSHPADLILTLTSASSREDGPTKDWRIIIKELLAADGGILNLYAGFPARAVFFFLVIGLQFFLYDYIKTLLDVGTDDLTLVLDVFYAVRSGLQ
ncbi:hypothetical protein HJC23_002119 [Cyclotella cryptica]|uniref:Uncharacterized protein n=1 Tax=Cyclotella cryptica TaxID=29204 RepID=A0ABD3Q0P1_9STRA